MPFCDHDATSFRRCTRSRLGESLLRLQHNLAQSRHIGVLSEDQFQAWQERWSAHREQIASRLELIDLQLEMLVRDNDQQPQLSVVGTAPHDDEALLLPTS